MKKIIYIFLATATLMTALSACHSSKSSVSESGDTTPSGDRAAKFDLAKVIDAVPAEWTTLQVPLTIEMESPASFKAGAKAYMTRDSSIYLSFTILGMEMAAVQITNDSVLGVDKLHKRYVAESISSITANYPVSVSTFQDMLMGQIFLPGVNTLTEKNLKEFKLRTKENRMDAIPVRQYDPFALSFHFSPDDMLECCQVLTENSTFSMTYTNPTQMTLGSLPGTEYLFFGRNKLNVKATMTWNWRKARIDNPADNKILKINPAYQRVSAMELLKKLI